MVAGRLRARWLEGETGRALRLVAVPFAAGKIVTLAVPVLTVWSRSHTPSFPSWSELTAPFGSWDGQHYITLATSGYPRGPLDLQPDHPGFLWAFFPGFPLLLRAARAVVPDIVAAGVLLNTVLELAVLVYLARLVMLERDERSAHVAVWLLVLYPYAVFMTAVFTESAFLAFTCASLFHMRRGRPGDHLLACALAALAVAVRPTGLALIPALAVEHLARRGRHALPGLAAALLPLVPFALFMLYSRALTGNLFAYEAAENSVSFSYRHLVWPWSAVKEIWGLATGTGEASYTYLFALEVAFALGGLLAAAALWWSRRIGASLAVYATAVWVVSTAESFPLSIPRYLIAMVPAFLLGADIAVRRPRLGLAVAAISGALMAYTTSIFATGRFVA